MKRIILIISILIMLLCFLSCAAVPAEETEEFLLSRDQLHVIFLDVGQGDSILILSPSGQNLLIDTGETDAYDALQAGLARYGVSRLNHVIATHPHSDHIGGMYRVLGDYDAETLYTPDTTADSRIAEKMLESAENNNVTLRKAADGVAVALGDDVKLEMYSPFSDAEEDLNNLSPIMLLTYGETSFLFTGDADSETEAKVLQKHPQLSADVMKLGHHGASTSNSPEFLDAVSPQIAVCSVGADNTFGHPHESVVGYLAEHGITLLRTDLLGNIILSSDGVSVTCTAEQTENPQPDDPKEKTVYKEKIGEYYHTTLCEACENSTVTEITLAEAEALGLKPCRECEK